MKQENSSLKEKLTGFRLLNQLVSKFSNRNPKKTLKSPISLILHWLGIGDIIVCGAILRGLKLRYPDCEISFYLQSTDEIDARDFLAWAHLVWPLCFICNGNDVPGRVFEIGRPGHLNGDPERLGVPGLRHDLWAGMCGTTAEPYVLKPSRKGLAKAKELLQSLGVNTAKPIVYLSPVTANKWRNWPIEKWRSLEQHLNSQSLQVVIGAVKPEPWASKEELEKFLTPYFIGKYDPEVLLGVLGWAVCIVSNDSGFAHLGGIMNWPTVAVCGGNYDGYACYGWYNSVQVAQAISRNIDDVEVEDVFNVILSSIGNSNCE